MFARLKDLWSEVSIQLEYQDNEEGIINSWILYWLLPSIKKIRARDNCGTIYVATSDKAQRIKIQHKLTILNELWLKWK